MLTRRRFLAGGALAALAVVLSRRLLIAGGGGSFTVPGLVVTDFTAAPAGGWTWFNGPCAIHSGSTTYFGYVKGTNGDLCARTIADGSLSVGAEQVVYPAFEQDDHEAPSMLVRASDSFVCMAFTVHVGDIYFAVGASAGVLPSGLGDVTNITSQVGARATGYGYTYAGLSQVSAQANTLYLWFRWHDSGGTAHISYSKSTDNGATWGARVNVAVVTYHQFAVNGSDRIDFVASMHADEATDPGDHSIYHFYFVPSTNKYFKSDGTEITASLPFAKADMTKVYDGATTNAWMWDIAIASGNPVITYATFPGNDGSDHRYNYAKWSGSAWSNNEFATAGGRIPTADQPPGNAQAFYSGGVVLDRSNPSVVYCSIGLGSGRWDIYRYTTTDGGATWSSVPLTSSGKNIRPVAVQGYGDVQALWMLGTYTTYIDYSTGTTGVGT